MLGSLFDWLGRASDRVTALLLNEKVRSEPRSDDEASLLRGAQLRSVFAQSRFMMIANIMNAFALLALEAALDQVSRLDVLWAVLVCSYALNGLSRGASLRARDSVRSRASRRGAGKLIFASIGLALLWTYPVSIVIHSGLPTETFFIGALITGMIAGGAIALYPIPLAALCYVVTLMLAVFPAIFFGVQDYWMPFLLVALSFFTIIITSILHHTRLFASEFHGRSDAELQRDMVELLVGQGGERSDHALWQANVRLELRTSAEPVSRLFGLSAPSLGPTVTLTDLIRLSGATPERPEDQDVLRALMARDATLSRFALNLRLEATSPEGQGRLLNCTGQKSCLPDSDVALFSGFVQDVTEAADARRVALRLASTDPMTGLLNYRAFLAQAAERMASADWQGGTVGLFFIDADNLKRMNDSFGHNVGDALIETIGVRLAGCAVGDSLVCRKGGDEFILLTRAADGDGVEQMARIVHANLNRPFRHEARWLPMHCSVGGACKPLCEANLGDLLVDADRALQFAKMKRGHGLQMSTPTVRAVFEREARLVTGLRRALARDAIELVFQPITGPRGQSVRGAEALLRWKDGARGDVAPPEIIALAKREGLGGRLTDAILRRALTTAGHWPAHFFVSVNVGAAELVRPDFADRIRAALVRQKFPPHRLWIEITETEALIESQSLSAAIRDIRDMGVRFALDDFGSGYSSIETLQSCQTDVIKFDRVVMQCARHGGGGRKLLEALIAVAREQSLTVLVEGVEEREDLEILRQIDVDFLQGFHMYRPMDSGTFDQIVAHDVVETEVSHASPQVAEQGP